MIILRFIQGFCMALADSVPGVSGGTVAFLMGFYDDFITSLNNIFSRDKEKRKSSWMFLLKIGIGWILAMILAVLILERVFHTHIYAVSSLFIGFIVFAIPVVIYEEKQQFKGKYWNSVFALAGIALVVGISFLTPSGSETAIDASSLDVLMCIRLFVSAAMAISAMVLPGISGSTLLLIFGLYVPVISAIKEVLHFNLEYVPALACFGLGVIFGAVVIVKLIKLVLEKFRSQTMYFIIGLMIGSIWSIIQGPLTLDPPQEAISLSSFNVLFFIIGGVVVGAMQFYKVYAEKKAMKK